MVELSESESFIDVDALATAAREFSNLQAQAENARVALSRLQHDAAATINELGTRERAQLLEVNEQLVIATLRAHSDVDQVTLALAEMSRTAHIDALTELPNRVLLLDRLTQAIAQARRDGARLALMFLDLNNFKHINNTLGHAVGDQVLKRVARVLTSSVRAMDTVSRHSGDEFLILLSVVSQKSDAALIADKILTALAIASRVGEQGLNLTANIGIGIYPDDGADAETLIDRADIAMYRARRQGRGGFAFYGELQESMGDGDQYVTQAPQQETQPLAAPQQSVIALAEPEAQYAQLREANEQLIIAALTAQELQAAAQQAQQRQTEFMAKLAHELRNPLTPIRTAAALLGELDGDITLLPALQAMIERQVVQMVRLVDDLCDVSRANTNKLRLQSSLVDVIDIIDAAVAAFRPAIEARRQNFTVQSSNRIMWVHGDPVRLAQILNNLLDNASKYTPEDGDIVLSIKLLDAAVAVTVSDSGIGITAAELPHVFDAFMQEPHAIGFNGRGLGLGLTVVRELVEAHGGTIAVTSKGKGCGSQFTVTLPLVGRLG